MGWIKNLKKAGDCESCDCPPAVCDACCPAPVLVCETRSASKTKFAACGVLNSGTYYMVMVETMAEGWTRTTTYTQNPTTGACTSTVVCAGSYTRTYSIAFSFTAEGDAYECEYSDTYVYTVNADCSITSTQTAGSYYNSVQYSEDHGGDFDEIIGTFDPPSWTVVTKRNGEELSTSTETSINNPCAGGTVTETYDPTLVTPSTAYSVPWTPETTSALIARTEAALPSWPGTWLGSSCTAFRNLSSDESSYTIREARFKFKLPTGASLPSGKKLSISYHTSFAPEGGGSPTVDNYTIEITGTESSIITIAVPTTDGTTSLTMTGYECVPV